MKKIISIILVSIILTLFLCSWVDPSSVNVYYGTLSGSGIYNGYKIEFYVNDTSHLHLSSNGVLINTDRYTVSGKCRLNSLVVLPMRFDPDDGFQLHDSNNWVSYDLIPDQEPSHFVFPVWLGFLGLLLIFLCVVFSVIGRFNI